jgi:hypothetical protein
MKRGPQSLNQVSTELGEGQSHSLLRIALVRPLSDYIAAPCANCHIFIPRRENVNLVCLKLFFWIASFLVLMELGLEVRAYQRGWDTMLFGFSPPTQSVSQQQANSEFGPTPAFPFRSRIVPLERESGNHRYWVASSSHAEDIYLPPPMIFPNILEHFLKEGKINAVVLNASRAGIDIPGNVDDLKRWGGQWKPDYAILYQMSLSIGSIAKHVLGAGAQVASANANKKVKEGPVAWINRLVEKTTIYANVKGQITARIGASRVLSNGLGVQAEQEFTAMLRDFIGAARSIGSVPVLTTFATSHTRKQLGEIPQDIALGLFKYSSVLSVEGWVASVEQFNAVVKRVAIDEQILLIDVESTVAGHPEYFRDFVHFTPAGHEAVAKAMGVALLHFEQEDAMVSADLKRAAP